MIYEGSVDIKMRTYSRGQDSVESATTAQKNKKSKKSMKRCNSQVSLHKGSSQRKDGKTETKLHKLLQRLVDGDMLAYCDDKLKLGAGALNSFSGEKKGSRILCHCCKGEISASKFEDHAGFGSRKNPYSFIFVVSTGELLDNSKNKCSGCQNSSLLDSASQTQLDVYAGRTSVAPVKQTKSDICVGSVESKGVEVLETSCCLCRKTDFAKNEFGPRTILLCDQCDREYHVGCFNKEKKADLKEEPIGDWFCCLGCETIHSSLHSLLNEKVEPLESVTTDFDVSLRLLSPLCLEMAERKQWFSQAIDVLEKGFGSLPSRRAKGGILRRIVCGMEDDVKQYHGMYCAVLLADSKVVSAAVFRLFGQEFAELPLVSTLRTHERKGYFYKVFHFLHKLCKRLNVKKIVLPATEAAMGLWLKLGFKRMTADQLSEQQETFPDVVEFRDVVMMQLQLSSSPSTANDAEAGTSL